MEYLGQEPGSWLSSRPYHGKSGCPWAGPLPRLSFLIYTVRHFRGPPWLLRLRLVALEGCTWSRVLCTEPLRASVLISERKEER